MSQKDQVLSAIQKIKQGTFYEIRANIDFSAWKTKTPDSSLRTYLAKLIKEGKIKQDGNIWFYGNKINRNINKGLYLITLYGGVKDLLKTFAFKVGLSDKDIKGRIKYYNSILPVSLVEELSYYSLFVNSDSLKLVETQVRTTLLKYFICGYQIQECYNGNQKEWLKISFPVNKEKEVITKLIQIFRKIAEEATASIKILKKQEKRIGGYQWG